jgi:phosphoserine aminotransferase
MRKWNFSAGPAAIPEEVLQEAQAEMLEWEGSGMSAYFLEQPHMLMGIAVNQVVQ